VFSVPENERSRRHTLRSRLAWLGFGTVSAGVWIAPGQLADETQDVLSNYGLAPYVTLFRADYLAFGDVREQVGPWWDLARLEELYQAFIDSAGPVLARWAGGTDAAGGGGAEGAAARAAAGGAGGQADEAGGQADEAGGQAGGDGGRADGTGGRAGGDGGRADGAGGRADEESAAFADYVRVLTAWRRLPFLDPGLPAELLPAGWHGTRAAELFDALRDALAAPARAHVLAVTGRPSPAPALDAP
jgi:phenylacetic acid degradation operon negative regulatory protein